MPIIQADMVDGRTSMQVGLQSVPRVSDRPDARRWSGAVVGVALAAVIPAAFWTAAVWLVCLACGVDVAPMVLASIAGGITLFLTVVCSAVMANR